MNGTAVTAILLILLGIVAIVWFGMLDAECKSDDVNAIYARSVTNPFKCVKTCNQGFTLNKNTLVCEADKSEGDSCQPDSLDFVENAVEYELQNTESSSTLSCAPIECEYNFKLQGGACVKMVAGDSCVLKPEDSIPNAKSFEVKTIGDTDALSCTVASCNESYSLVGGACVSD